MNRNHARNTHNIVSRYLNQYIKKGYICLDATIGNGNDIYTIARLVGENGKVYGFDIQELAINNTRKLLKSHDILDRAIIIRDSHENIDTYIEDKLNFIIYNLGYLPKGDKSIKTRKDSTSISIKKALKLMAVNSIMLITAYVGHPGGLEENITVNNLLNSLDQREFNVIKYEFINQRNSPPLLYAVEKL